MNEGRRVVVGEAILDGAGAIDRNMAECSRDERKDETLEELVREHSALVYRIAYAVLRRHHDAEDATQETFVRVLRYSSKLGSVEDQKTWLARIAWRVAVDRSRQRSRKGEIPLHDPENPQAEPASCDATADEALQAAQFEARVEKLIAALPEKLRQPLILSTIEEMSPREIAATLRVNEAAVRSRIFRARQILKEKLAQQTGRRQVEP
jgi:RNA polymerase sigma-70 factor, ECF subfamily